jgi:hypothetical protein
MTARYVWSDARGHLQGSQDLRHICAELTAVPSKNLAKLTFVFDNRQTIKRFCDQMHLSNYQMDVLTTGARQPWAIHELVSLSDLFRFGYGETAFNPNASLHALYEKAFGDDGALNDLYKIQQLYCKLAVKDAALLPRTDDPIQIFIDKAYEELYAMRWLSSMMSATNTRWNHARNMRLTDTVLSLWSTIHSIRGQGLLEAIESGVGIELELVGAATWKVTNRPKKIVASGGMIVVPRYDTPSKRFMTVLEPTSPKINERDEITLNFLPLGSNSTVYGKASNMLARGTLHPLATHVVCLPIPYLPFPGSFRSNKSDTPLPRLVPPTRIRVLRSANRKSESKDIA